MTSETQIHKIIGQLEAEVLGSRCLDEMIATAVYGEPRRSGSSGGPWTLVWWDRGLGRSEAPRFTASLDAEIPGERIRCVLLMGDGRWEAEAMSKTGDYYRAEAHTEAMARRAAALRARMEP